MNISLHLLKHDEFRENSFFSELGSEKLISESYVIKEAVIEANALLKKAEIEVQSDRAKIEDEIDSVLTNLENTLGELLGIINKQKEALRKPRLIENPEEEQGD